MDMTYEIIPDENVEVFRDLCNELMAFQRSKALIAPERFDTMNFDTRMLPTVKGALHNYLILAKAGEEVAGYAYANVAPKENYASSFATFFDMSTVDRDNVGCLSQLYLREEYRGTGSGSRLFDMCMSWLDQFDDVEDRFIFVSNGNNDAYDFYLRKGYVFSHTILDGFILILRNRK